MEDEALEPEEPSEATVAVLLLANLSLVVLLTQKFLNYITVRRLN